MYLYVNLIVTLMYFLMKVNILYLSYFFSSLLKQKDHLYIINELTYRADIGFCLYKDISNFVPLRDFRPYKVNS